MAFHVGRLRSPRLDHLAEHVESCPHCDAVLRGLDTAVDPVFQALRDPAALAPLRTADKKGDIPLEEGVQSPFLSAALGPGPTPTRSPTGTGDPSANWPIIPGYEVLKLLGRGGMGIVYQARHVRLNRLVALKRLGVADDMELSRARAEAQALARLQHPNIVQIHEVLDHGGRVYLVLELVEGEALGAVLHGKPRAARESAALIEVLARAIHYAHERGIIHRDLKPANILLAGAPGHESGPRALDFERWMPKITDFGIAKSLTSAIGETRQGDIIGTPSYMSPEQAAGQPERVGPPSDVYGLGVILYELLTGRVPLLGPSTLDTLMMVRAADPVAARRLQPKVPRDLDTICMKCLRKEPAQRYASAAELADDLRRFQNNEPIRARPIRLWERSWKWAKRRPAIAALSASVLLVAAVGFILVTWQWRRAENTAQAEREAKQTAREQAHRVEVLLAGSMLSQATALCERGHIDRGLLGLVQALEMAEHAHEPELEQAARYNLAAWQPFLVRLRGQCPHDSWVWAVAVSPDSRTVLTGSADGTAKRWDAATSQLIGQPLKHKYPVWAVAFSPDGRHIVTGAGAFQDKPGEARVWDARTGRLVYSPISHEYRITDVQFSPDGRSFLTVCEDAVRCWRLVDGLPAGPPLRHPKPARVNPRLFPKMVAMFSPDGKTIATGAEDGTVRFWDAATHHPRGQPMVATGPVLTIAFSPDSHLLASGSFDGGVQLWNVESGTKRGPLLHHPGAVLAVRFNQDGQTLAVGGSRLIVHPQTGQRRLVGGQVQLWQVATGYAMGPALAHPAAVWSVAFSPSGRLLLSGCEDGGARLFMVATGAPLGQPLVHEGTVRDVAFGPDGTLAVTASAGGGNHANARIWSVSPEHAFGRPTLQGGATVDLAFTADGKMVLTRWQAAPGGAADLDTGRSTSFPESFQKPILLVPLDDHGQRLLVCDGDGSMRRWDHGQWHSIRARPPGFEPYACAFTSNRHMVVFGDAAGVAYLRDARTGKDLEEIRPNQGRIYRAAFSTTGDRIALVTEVSITVWEVGTHRLIHQWPAAARAIVTFHPDGKRLYLVNGGVAQVRDLDSGQLLEQPRFHREGAIQELAFSPDGQKAVVVGSNQTAAVWDVATGQRLGPSLASDGAVSAAFSPDGRHVVVGHMDGRLNLWNISSPVTDAVEDIHAQVEALGRAK